MGTPSSGHPQGKIFSGLVKSIGMSHLHQKAMHLPTTEKRNVLVKSAYFRLSRGAMNSGYLLRYRRMLNLWQKENNAEPR